MPPRSLCVTFFMFDISIEHAELPAHVSGSGRFNCEYCCAFGEVTEGSSVEFCSAHVLGVRWGVRCDGGWHTAGFFSCHHRESDRDV